MVLLPSGGPNHLKPNLHQTCLPLETKPKGNNVPPPPFPFPSDDKGDGSRQNICFCKHLHCSVSARFSWIMMESCRTSWGADSRKVSSSLSMLTSAYSNIMAQYQRRWCSF